MVRRAVQNRSRAKLTKLAILPHRSGKDGKGIRQSLEESLEYLGVKSVDLYLIVNLVFRSRRWLDRARAHSRFSDSTTPAS